MLTKEEQQRIREEEIFRAEVQRELRPAELQTIPAKFLRFFNSSLGIWALSSVLLTGLTAVYTHWQTSVASTQQAKEANNKLLGQCVIRNTYAKVLFDQADQAVPKTDPDFIPSKREAYLQAIAALVDDTPDTRLGPEFKDRSTMALIFESGNRNANRNIKRNAKNDVPYPEFAGDILQLMQLRKKLADSNWTKLSSEEQKAVLDSIDLQRKNIETYAPSLLYRMLY